MRRTPRFSPPRPFALARRTPRSRPEAAAELVRLEYERDRLERDLALIDDRKAAAEARLRQVEARAVRLRAMLTEEAG